MDKDLFESCVRIAKARLNTPTGLHLTSTAAEGRARGYLTRHLPQKDRQQHLTRLIDESPYDKSSWDALDLIAQKLIRTGKRFPRELADWTSDVLADQMAKRGEKRRPRPAKGSHKKAGRDWNYYWLVEELAKSANVDPTRNDETKPKRSPCDAVAVASGVPYKTVARIWSDCSHQMRNV